MIYDYFYEFASEALHIVIFENFIKSMTSCLSKLKVTPSFCFAFKIPDDPTTTNVYIQFFILAQWNVDTFSGSHFKKVGEKKCFS
jgi:hypothetical protein